MGRSLISMWEKKGGGYLGVKTCEIFSCFGTIVFLFCTALRFLVALFFFVFLSHGG